MDKKKSTEKKKLKKQKKKHTQSTTQKKESVKVEKKVTKRMVETEKPDNVEDNSHQEENEIKKNTDIIAQLDKKEQKKQYLFLIKELTTREIKRKYSRSVLGIVWSVLNPLLSMTVLSMIFTQILIRSIENFPVFYLTGYILWHMFTGATTAAMTTFVDNKALLMKVKLPMQVFILAKMYTAVVNLQYSLVAYAVILFVFQISIKSTILFAPVIIIFLALFALGVSYILSTAYVFFGDVKHLYTVLLTLWMHCSAIMYPLDRLQGIIRTIVQNNPIFTYVDSMRKVVMYGELPTFGAILRMVLWGVGMYILGYKIFKKHKDAIIQKI